MQLNSTSLRPRTRIPFFISLLLMATLVLAACGQVPAAPAAEEAAADLPEPRKPRPKKLPLNRQKLRPKKLPPKLQKPRPKKSRPSRLKLLPRKRPRRQPPIRTPWLPTQPHQPLN